MVEKFKQLGISGSILQAIEELGFEEPTEIQEKTIPLVINGKDIIAGASTGSGKTLAFGCGVIGNSKPDFGLQSLILTPTRELAEQIMRELRKFSKNKKLNIISIYGGMSMGRQIDELKHAEVVVGTPGRILDHLSRRTINFQYIKTLVLDEADRMFDMGFKDDVEKIIGQCPEKRQTLLYSATISQDIVLLATRHMNNPIEISAEAQVDPSKLKQIYYDAPDNLKYSLLKHLLENEKSKLVMVFCNTRKNVDFVSNNLKSVGIESLPIHGGFTQEKRNRIMQLFHSETVHVLVCTDVAARGLDVKGISHVYNYDIPREAKEYIHRIGRTARAGNEGKVINIITSRDYDNFAKVLKYNPEFKISLEPTPYIKKIEIKWMPPSRYGRNSGSRGRDSRGGRRPSFGGKSSGSRWKGRNDRERKPYDRRESRGESRERENRRGPRRDSGRTSESKKGYEKRETKRKLISGSRPNSWSKKKSRRDFGRNKRR